LGVLKQIRQPFEDGWKAILELVRPDLCLWDDAGNLKNQGKKRNINVYNGSPQQNLLIWRDGLLGRIASPSLDWFYYLMAEEELNEIPGVKDWLEDCKAGVKALMKHSNYYSHLASVMLDAGSIGCAPGWIEKGVKDDKIVCENFHPYEVYVDENSDGDVNQWARGPFEMSAMQAQEKYDQDKLSWTLQQTLTAGKDPLERFKFTHFCLHKKDPLFKGIEGLPDREWISFYLQDDADDEHREPVKIGGYNTKPFTYWRMFETPGSVYSLGLASFALIDIFGLNQITRTMLRAAHLAVEPATYAAADMRGKIHIKPGGRMFGEPQSKPEIVYDGGKYPYGADMLDRQTAAVRQWFDVDFFLMLSKADKVYTATQIMQMANERAILLAPKIGRLQQDKLSQDHDRIFALAVEMGKIPPPPPVLLDEADGKIDVQYNGLLDRAQRQFQQIEQMEITLNQYAKILEVAPQERYRVRWDKLSKRILRQSEAIKEDEIATDEEFNAAVQAEQQQMQAQQLLAAAEQAGKAMPGLSKAPESGSPIDQLAAAAGAPA